jgi:hypothetical protein
LVRDNGFVRRDYVRGSVRINVTIARAPVSAEGFAAWAEMSATYPLVRLEVAPSEVVGFFDCSVSGGKEACSAHLQSRAGHHIEVMGGGTATRADLEALLPKLRLGALVAQPLR